MSVNRRPRHFVALATAVIASVATIQCGGSGSPTGPTTSGVASVALNATSVAAGSTVQGTVNLTAPAPAGSMISVSSSNPGVATVQSSLAVPAGSSSATLTVTAVAAGTAAITTTLNGSSKQSPMLTVTGATVILTALSLSTSTVVGGNALTGTVTLNAAAPAGGAVVALTGGDPASVASSVTVPAGSATATFSIATREVGGAMSATISGSYGGASASAVLMVTPTTVAIASFGVTGPTETDTCTMANNGNTLNCTFNGSTSKAPGTIIAWDWTFGVATMFRQTTTGPVLTMPRVNCSLLPSPPLPAGPAWFTLTVMLTIHDSLGNVAEMRSDGARVIPKDVCGF